jgi:hypothetical protein
MSMPVPVWYGPYVAAAALLVAAGGVKAVRPSSTTKALRQARIPATDWAVRAGAVAEVAIGVAALAGTTAGAALTAASYALFAAFVALGLRTGSPISTCGCFGEPDAKPTVLHLVLNVGAAAVAAVGVTGTAPALTAHLDPTFLLLTGTVAYLTYLAMSVLPRVHQTS